MTRDHSQKTPDPTAAVRKLLAPLTDKPPETPERPSPRHVLPKNLPEAIRHLDDHELARLLAAAIAEQYRRGKKQPVPDSEQRVEAAPSSLKRGQKNAIRAAFKAGVKPSQIARQFGISQSDVRKALASDEPER